ncbi:MAG: polyphosphate:AMP phosphotransferase [Verrucomicrobia bacterium]|nr:MAG: polyphosphate:AMP phosphotransferase [Verrucomicrobiota bacterium]
MATRSVLERSRSALHLRLLAAQRRLAEKQQGAIIVIGGNDRLAASELANQLTEWFDARTVRVCAPDTASSAGRPFLWPYWQDVPAKGRVTIVVGDWLTRTTLEVSRDKLSGEPLRTRLKSLRTFEEMLAADGTSVVKVWLETPEKSLRRRLREAEDTDAEGWVVSADDLLLAKKSSLTLARELRSQGSGKNLPWKVVIGGAETKLRDLHAGLAIADQLNQASRRRAAAKVKKPGSRPRGLLESAAPHPTLDKKAYSQQMAKLQVRLGRLTRLAHKQGLSTVVVLEGPDAAGKGGAIRRLCGLLDAAHYQVFPTPAPTPEEKARHYLWRFWNKVPAPGRLAVFDRSWFGRVMVERVEGFAQDAEWARAYAEINDFEARLAEAGMVVLKVWINISKEEQLRRFQAREDSPHKRHKMTAEDYRNRKKWDANLRAAEDMISRTDTPHAPWVVVSADDKRHARVATLKAVCRALSDRLD